MLLPLLTWGRGKSNPVFGRLLVVIGALGLAWLLIQGFGIGLRGWRYPWLTELFGKLDGRQFGMGYGALLTGLAFLFLMTLGIAARGAVGGDVFVVGSIGFVIATITLFVFMPIVQMLVNALITEQGGYSLAAFGERLFSDRLWSLGCVSSGTRCGVAWNSFFLAVVVGLLSTLLGLAFALVATRTGFRFRRILRALTVLPIITPAFVIGLAVILLFGLSGFFTQLWADLFGVQPTRWVYGLPGLLIAQTLAFTPIAFLVLIGVVEGVSPSMEEAAQTLRASRWQTFVTVTLPLMRPGLANAFLLGFIESMADFGNPLVLGGNFDVLSTEIFFAIVGAQNDPGMAATLAVVLLVFTLAAFYAQRFWLGRRSYTTVSGKGDAGIHPFLPGPLRLALYAAVGFWVALTLIIYGTIVYGSFQAEALAVSDRIIVMDRAVIAQEGRPRDLYDAPATAFVADFIGESNILPCEIVAVHDGVARVRAGPVALDLPSRGLAPGPARLSIRPHRLAISSETANTLPGVVTKIAYAGSHTEIELETVIGQLFLMSTDTACPPSPGTHVHLDLPATGSVLLLA